MYSFGSHYRADLQEGTGHVTSDSGVAELKDRKDVVNCSGDRSTVELARVGALEDILVLRYGNNNVVLMVVSWVAQHSDICPMLTRDAHGFWLANMGAVPRDRRAPYLLPSLATQVKNADTVFEFQYVGIIWDHAACMTSNMALQWRRCSLLQIKPCQDGALCSKMTLKAEE